MSKKRAVICLAAGKSQLIVIRKAQKLGFAVIAVDRNPHALGFDLAEEKIIASTYEVQPIIEHLEKLAGRYTFTAIVNRSAGPPVVTAAELSKHLGLPGVSPDVARMIIDKGLLKEHCGLIGLPVPLGRTIAKSDDLADLEYPLPCIVKPALSLLGKNGIRIVFNPNDLAEAVEEARAASFEGRVVIETFVPGYNVSLIGFVKSGRLEPLVLVDELNGTDNTSRVYGKGMAVPSRFYGLSEEQLITNAAQAIVAKLGLVTSVCCMSFRCDFDGLPILVEIHLDMGGDLILDQLIPASTNFDIVTHFIRGLAGESQELANVELSPVAVLFGQGSGLVSERPFRLLRSSSREALEPLILSMEENIYA